MNKYWDKDWNSIRLDKSQYLYVFLQLKKRSPRYVSNSPETLTGGVQSNVPAKSTISKSWFQPTKTSKIGRKTNLVGGFNPFEKYYSKWESSPSRDEQTKNVWNHHLVMGCLSDKKKKNRFFPRSCFFVTLFQRTSWKDFKHPIILHLPCKSHNPSLSGQDRWNPSGVSRKYLTHMWHTSGFAVQPTPSSQSSPTQMMLVTGISESMIAM